MKNPKPSLFKFYTVVLMAVSVSIPFFSVAAEKKEDKSETPNAEQIWAESCRGEFLNAKASNRDELLKCLNRFTKQNQSQNCSSTKQEFNKAHVKFMGIASELGVNPKYTPYEQIYYCNTCFGRKSGSKGTDGANYCDEESKEIYAKILKDHNNKKNKNNSPAFSKQNIKEELNLPRLDKALTCMPMVGDYIVGMEKIIKTAKEDAEKAQTERERWTEKKQEAEAKLKEASETFQSIKKETEDAYNSEMEALNQKNKKDWDELKQAYQQIMEAINKITGTLVPALAQKKTTDYNIIYAACKKESRTKYDEYLKARQARIAQNNLHTESFFSLVSSTGTPKDKVYRDEYAACIQDASNSFQQADSAYTAGMKSAQDQMNSLYGQLNDVQSKIDSAQPNTDANNAIKKMTDQKNQKMSDATSKFMMAQTEANTKLAEISKVLNELDVDKEKRDRRLALANALSSKASSLAEGAVNGAPGIDHKKYSDFSSAGTEANGLAQSVIDACRDPSDQTGNVYKDAEKALCASNVCENGQVKDRAAAGLTNNR